MAKYRKFLQKLQTPYAKVSGVWDSRFGADYWPTFKMCWPSSGYPLNHCSTVEQAFKIVIGLST
jgi:hypothetical protein